MKRLDRPFLLCAATLLVVSCTTKTIGPPELDRSPGGGDAGASGSGADGGAAEQACDPTACGAIDDYPEGCAEARCVDGACRYVARDADGDGFTALRCVSRTAGVSVETGEDCDDADDAIGPNRWDGPAGDGFDDACGDGIDQDCSGRVDDGTLADGSSCTCRTGETGVCMETASGILLDYPALDDAGDPVGICAFGSRECLPNGTWGPCVGAIGPAPETCDGLDNDCDTITSANDEDTPKLRFYCDRDNDGQLSSTEVPDDEPAPPEGTEIDDTGAAASSVGCAPEGDCAGRWLTGAQAQFFDCDDGDPQRFLGALEACDGLDTDCDGALDGPDEDDDGDGYADDACAGNQALDCDDTDPLTHVGAVEICDGRDNDCMKGGERRTVVEDGSEPDEDADGDGHSALDADCTEIAGGFPRNDCDDLDPTVYAGAPELCDGKDNDCDGVRDNLDGGARLGEACGIASVSGGRTHACALRHDGDVVCWGGANGSAQLGRDVVAGGASVHVDGIDPAVQVVAGDDFSCALHADGTVSCWGAESILTEQQDISFFGTSVPREVEGLTGASQITAGGRHACALVDGAVFCWGNSSWGEVDGVTTGNRNQSFPLRSVLLTQVSPGQLTDVVQIDAGSYRTCAVTGSNTLHCWGHYEDAPFPTLTTADAPVAGIDDALEVAVGEQHVCIRRTDATVACMGYATGGALLDYSGPEPATTPHPIAGLTDIVAISAGLGRHTCALEDGGQLWCWGDNSQGQLGDYSTDTPSAPVAPGWYAAPFNRALGPVRAMSAGDGFTCALDDGGMWCMGAIGSGANDGILDFGWLGPTAPVRMSHFARPVGISVGNDVCFKLPSGDLGCMGNSQALSGECPSGLCLGDLPRSSSNEDCGCFWGPESLNGDIVEDIAIGADFHCVVLDDGDVACAGVDPFVGELSWQNPPDSLTGAVAVAVGAQHGCAISDDGTVTCWGEPQYLGATSSPAQPEVSGFAREIVAGAEHTCVLLLDGGVDCWGRNHLGQAGIIPVGTDVDAPTRVPLPGPATALAASGDATCAVIGSEGAVACWGDNANLVLGTDVVTSSATPLLVPFAGPAVGVALTPQSACALGQDGRVLCWGDNGSGELGRVPGGSETIPTASPQPVDDIGDAVDLGCGPDKCCATRSSGQAVCWGNASSQCGAPATTPTPVRELETSGLCCFDLTFPQCPP